MPSYTHILPHHQYPAPDLYICYNESTLTDQYHQKSIGFNLGILYSIGLDRMNYTYHFGIIQKSFTVLKHLENEFSFQVFAALIWLFACMFLLGKILGPKILACCLRSIPRMHSSLTDVDLATYSSFCNPFLKTPPSSCPLPPTPRSSLGLLFLVLRLEVREFSLKVRSSSTFLWLSVVPSWRSRR